MKQALVTLMLVSGIFVTAGRAEGPASTPPAPVAAAPAIPADAPKIVFDNTTYDFGKTSMVTSVTGTFTFSNAGKSVLEVKKPQPSCGCTVAAVKPESLKPGEKGELVFTVNIGAISRGHLEKHITVPSNDPASPSVNLTIKTDITSIYDSQPMSVNLGAIRVGNKTNATVMISRNDGQKLAVQRIEGMNNNIETKLEPIDGEATKMKLAINVLGDGGPRRFNESIRVFVEGNPTPVLTVPIYGQYVGDISLMPEAIFWGIADPTTYPGQTPALMTTRTVRVTSNAADKSYEIRNVNSSLPDLQVSVNTIQAGKIYEIIAKLPAAPKQSERGVISFETTMAGMPSMQLPVTINVLQR